MRGSLLRGKPSRARKWSKGSCARVRLGSVRWRSRATGSLRRCRCCRREPVGAARSELLSGEQSFGERRPGTYLLGTRACDPPGAERPVGARFSRVGCRVRERRIVTPRQAVLRERRSSVWLGGRGFAVPAGRRIVTRRRGAWRRGFDDSHPGRQPFSPRGVGMALIGSRRSGQITAHTLIGGCREMAWRICVANEPRSRRTWRPPGSAGTRHGVSEVKGSGEALPVERRGGSCGEQRVRIAQAMRVCKGCSRELCRSRRG